MSIQNDASQAIGAIELLDAAFPTQTTAPKSNLQAPSVDYGGLPWVPVVLSNGATGYWAPKGDGTYYYYGSDGTLYDDTYTGQVRTQDEGSNAVGNVSTYDFGTTDTYSGSGVYYGGLYFG